MSQLLEHVTAYRQKNLSDQQIIKNLESSWSTQAIEAALLEVPQISAQPVSEEIIQTKPALLENSTKSISILWYLAAATLLLIVVGLIFLNRDTTASLSTIVDSEISTLKIEGTNGALKRKCGDFNTSIHFIPERTCYAKTEIFVKLSEANALANRATSAGWVAVDRSDVAYLSSEGNHSFYKVNGSVRCDLDTTKTYEREQSDINVAIGCYQDVHQI
jgi:hypothetical protein